LLFTKYEAKKQNTPQAQQLTEAQLPQAQVLGKKKNAPKPHTQAKKQNTPQAQLLTEVELPQAQVLGELVMEPINKALQEENGRLKAENGILKEREICKQELMDEYKARAKNMEEEIQRAKDEIQRGKDEIQRFRDEVTSLKEKEIRLAVENEYLKRRDEELRLVRTAESEYYKRRDEELRLELNAFQTTMSSLMNGMEDRKRKRNDDDDAE
jgi:predicted RNase H-like nuclease (RuvC/YqgF family)